MRRQSARPEAFLHAEERPMFIGLRSASTERNQVWLGLPAGLLQSGGGLRIAAAMARWWSSSGELRAMWPKKRSRLLVTMLDSGWQFERDRTSSLVMWRVYGILRILRNAHISNASRRAHKYFIRALHKHDYYYYYYYSCLDRCSAFLLVS